MPQSLSAVYIHLVFSTKNRERWFQDKGFREELHVVIGGISKGLDCPPLRIGGVEDHVHLLCRLGRTISQADWVKEIKRTSALWIKESSESFRDFHWQGGYAAFSVSQSNKESVMAYIAGQEEHHHRMSFQDEVRGLLRKHQVDWDERYVWD